MSHHDATIHYSVLDDRALIGVSGDDAEKFLQDLLTNDIAALEPDHWQYTALLSPQGKILFAFFIARRDAGFVIDCGAPLRDDLIKRLTLYKLRADVEIDLMDDTHAIVALWPASPGSITLSGHDTIAQICARDPRVDGAGWRCLMRGAEISAWADHNNYMSADTTAYDAHRLALGLPGDGDIGSGTRFIHESNLDKLNAVSFSKGCFIGQEVVSRVEHRSSARKRMMPFAVSGPAPAIGDEIRAGGKSIGEICSVNDDMALGLVRLDRLVSPDDETARTAPLQAGAATLTPRPPDWLTPSLATSAGGQ